jgi:uncharacterized protein with HEPN domain
MPRDDAYLLDILIAARQAMRFLQAISRQQFEKSELHQNAVFRSLEVIGEAAGLISEVFRLAHPEIPWGQMIGMRNRLIHEYFRINLSTVWDTVQVDLPDLVQRIEPLVPPEEETKD